MHVRRYLALALSAGLCACGDAPAASGGGTSTGGTSTGGTSTGPADPSTDDTTPTGAAATDDAEITTSTTPGDTSSATASSSGPQPDPSSTSVAESSSSSGSESGETSGSESGETTGLAEACDLVPANEPTPWSVSLGAPDSYLGVATLNARAGAVVYSTMSDAVLDLGGGLIDPAGASHIFMASHAPSGAFQWAEHIGGPAKTVNITSFHAATDCQGNVLLAGTFSGEVGVQGTTLTAVPGVEFDDGMSFPTVDWFLLKLGPDGTLLWAQRFGDAASQRVRGVGVQGDGTIVITGDVNGTLELGGRR